MNSVWQMQELLQDKFYTLSSFNALGIANVHGIARVVITDGWGAGTNAYCECYRLPNDVLRRKADGRPAGEFSGLPGNWISAIPVVNPTEVVMGSAGLYIYPFELDYSLRFNAMAQIISTAGAGTANGSTLASPSRMALFFAGVDFYPESMVAGTDLGEYAGGSVGAIKIENTVPVTLIPGRYCAVWSINSASSVGSRRASPSAGAKHILGRPPASPAAANTSLPVAGAPQIGWRHTVTYTPSAIPSIPARAAATSILAVDNIPQMLLRCV